MNRSRHRAFCQIRLDPTEQFLKQVEAAMNVAYGVDPGTLGK